MYTKRIMISLVFLALVGVGSASSQEKSLPVGKPKLVLDSFSHDFGSVDSGTPLSFTFKIKNEGSADLDILSVAPS